MELFGRWNTWCIEEPWSGAKNNKTIPRHSDLFANKNKSLLKILKNSRPNIKPWGISVTESAAKFRSLVPVC